MYSAPPVKGRTEGRAKRRLSLGAAMHQMTMQMVLPLEDRGETPNVRWSGEADSAAQGNERSGNDRLTELMERVVERDNLLAALKRVRRNKGSPGIDGMTVDGLTDYLRENWERIRASLLDGSYHRAR